MGRHRVLFVSIQMYFVGEQKNEIQGWGSYMGDVTAARCAVQHVWKREQ